MIRSNRLFRSAAFQVRKCSSTPPPPPPPTPPVRPSNGGRKAEKSSYLIRTLIVGAAGIGIGWIIAEIKKDKKDALVSKTDSSEQLADIQGMITDRVFFDVQFGSSPDHERIIIGLYGHECPKTTKNFLSICEGFQKSPSRKLSYQNCKFHRVIPGFMLQSGDITQGNGTGGESIYGNRFPDENFQHKHTGIGVVSMANRGKDTNSSQFFICVAPTPWLNNRHVVFGQVLHGLSTIKKIESFGSRSGTVSEDIRIAKCGVLPKLEDTIAYNTNKNEVLDETGRAVDRIMK